MSRMKYRLICLCWVIVTVVCAGVLWVGIEPKVLVWIVCGLVWSMQTMVLISAALQVATRELKEQKANEQSRSKNMAGKQAGKSSQE